MREILTTPLTFVNRSINISYYLIEFTETWFIPFLKPNSKNYYSCIGIYDYDIDNLAEVSNILDLIEIKKLGMEKADFGGSEQALLNFKMKFHPDEFYRTDIYAVEKN